jgi:hypothetical protein
VDSGARYGAQSGGRDSQYGAQSGGRDSDAQYSAQKAVRDVVEVCNKFDPPILFTRFLQALLTNLLQFAPPPERDAKWIRAASVWQVKVRDAQTAVGVYNQRCETALERLYTELKYELRSL